MSQSGLMQSQQLHTEINDAYIQRVFDANVFKIRVEARKAILPPPKISVSELAEEIRYLDDGSKWRNKKAPHAKEIMDWASDPDVREISIMGSAQCAKTEIIINIIFYFIKINPKKIMLMFPTGTNIKDFVRTKLDPSIENTPEIKKLVRNISFRNNERETSIFKKFPGGWLKIISGSATSGTRGITADVTITDDVDQLVIGQQREGDPAERLKKRTTKNKYSYLHINVSTPTILGSSRIDAYYGKSSMSIYKVMCPFCNTAIDFKTERLIWQKDFEETLFTKDLPDNQKKVLRHYEKTAVYPCDNCGSEITEKERMQMLENGFWEDRTESKTHKGAFINEISSTISSFANVAKQIIDMSDHPEKKEVLYNTVFGLPYDRGDVGEKVDHHILLERVEDYIDLENPFVVPNEIYFAVMTGDVQKNRLETLVIGIGYDWEMWVLLYQPIMGDPLQRKVFKDADKIYFADWRRKNGTKLPILRQWIDCAFLPKTVYDHTRGRLHKGICAVRGKGGVGVSILPSKPAVIDKKTIRVDIGSNATKHQIFQMLKVEQPGPNFIHLCSAYCDENFCQQLTAEQAIKKHVGLIEYIVYEKVNQRDRNEALDMMYYAYAAALSVNPNFKNLKLNIEKQFANNTKQMEIKSNYSVHHPQKQNETKPAQKFTRPARRTKPIVKRRTR